VHEEPQMSDKQAILIVEDEPELSEMLSEYLVAQGYEALSTAWGEEAVQICQDKTPSLVLLDIGLPDINGYEVARRIQFYQRTRNTPIIFLTQRHEHMDRMQGLEVGAVDYVTKPYDLQELHLRMRNILRRASFESLVNVTTGLPEGRQVDEHLADLISDQGWAIVVAHLRRMNRFREAYGFVAADDVLRAVATILKDVALKFGSESDLVGHLTAENFIMITTAANVAAVETNVRERLRQSIDYFYPNMGPGSAVPASDRLMFVTAALKADRFEDIDALKRALMRLVTAN
jgi:DNA-binding response OmpR family regulator